MVQNSASSFVNLSDDEDDMQRIPKPEMEQDISPGNMYLHQFGDNAASSSGTNLRSSFIGMGFSPVLVDKVIKEKGEDDIDLLLETLIELSTHQQSNSKSSGLVNSTFNVTKINREFPGGSSVSHETKAPNMSESASLDSLDSLFNDEKGEEINQAGASVPPKEEPIFLNETDGGVRASLLGMNFSVNEVEFAIDRLGKEAPIYELVDFISAAQMAEIEDSDYKEKNEDYHPETLYSTVDRTLRLLEMGFSEQDVSSAIESFEPEAPIQELADWICAGRPALPPGEDEGISDLYATIKTEDGFPEIVHQAKIVLQAREPNLKDLYGGKLPKEEYDDVGPFVRAFDLDDIKGKRVKEEYDDTFSAAFSRYPPKKSKKEELNQDFNTALRNPTMSTRNPPLIRTRNLDKMVAPPPFFLYGNVVNLSNDSWNKMSQFLYALEPDFATSQFFSAISRKEGYLHNLPTEERFLVEPKSPMTIEEAMPHTNKWWPAWDPRKQLSCINTETVGVNQICDNLRKMLVESRGLLSPEQQTKVLYHCRTLNLVWVGKYRLAPIEPEYLEAILGYPPHHTDIPEMRLPERLEALRTCFQTDTLAYHLSPLKCFFPDGLTMLSVYGSVGGAEVALHRLGVRLRGVVSVETSEAKRQILKRWWESSGQTGELVQIEDVQKLSSNKLEYLMNKFGGFDLVIGQNPCTYTAPRAAMPMLKPGDVVGLDFSLYCEFVRVLQRIKSMMVRRVAN
ncbi:hypothetical protein V2J09_008928 [Rumex salicifolius]